MNGDFPGNPSGQFSSVPLGRPLDLVDPTLVSDGSIPKSATMAALEVFNWVSNDSNSISSTDSGRMPLSDQPSFRDMVVGWSVTGKQDNFIDELDVVLQELLTLIIFLVLGIVIDGAYQAIEYEGLPVICFGCGKYGHSKDVCSFQEVVLAAVSVRNPRVEPTTDERFGPWMLVTNRSRKPSFIRREVPLNVVGNSHDLGSRFIALREVVDGVSRQSGPW
ncbi:hypothetical protein V6N13_116180 [Hibiscus sabdariffa]